VGQFNPPSFDGGQAARSITNLAAETQSALEKAETASKTG